LRTPPLRGGQIRVGRLRVKLAQGERLLDRMVAEGIPLETECGGALACASCCVIVREGAPTLSPPSDDELDMLERAGADEPGSRLACQARAAGGDVVVELPERKLAARAAGSRPVRVTEPAARFLAAQLRRHPAAVAVRLAVEPSGCSGFGYRIDPADSIAPDDAIFESGGVRIAVDASSLPYLQGTTVDIAQEELGRRLRFDNPNARQSCGCGASFGT
jgi:iron-sulfur cluster assembly protein